MTRDEILRIWPNASESTIQANLGVNTLTQGNQKYVSVLELKPGKRLRQSPKPELNKLETEWLAQMQKMFPVGKIRAQALKFRLGRGIFYKPDFILTYVDHSAQMNRMITYEVKGPHAFRGGFENLKVAAGLWPEVQFRLVWKDKNSREWMQQEVLP